MTTTTDTSTDKAFNPDRTPVAQDVFTYCTKEKIDTWHVVVHHDALGFVDRVQCKACKSSHKYRKLALAKVTRKKSPPGAKAIAARVAKADPAAFQDEWLAGIKGWGEKPVRAYSPTIIFVKGEVVNHEVFGKGYIKARRDNRVDVVFQNGLKVLPSPKA